MSDNQPSTEKGRFKIAVAEPGRYVVRITLPHSSDVIGTGNNRIE